VRKKRNEDQRTNEKSRPRKIPSPLSSRRTEHGVCSDRHENQPWL
jgi:hypothetical protein